MVSTIGCHTPAQSPNNLPCQKPVLCKVKIVFSKPVHAVRVGGGQPGTNCGPFKVKLSSHYVHVTLWVTPPTFLCHTLSTDTEPARKRTETIFSAQCAVSNQKCTRGFNGLSPSSCCVVLSAWSIAEAFDCMTNFLW